MKTRVMRTLPVRLEEDEVAIRAQELTEAVFARRGADEELELAAEAWKEEKKRLENRLEAAGLECQRLARIVKQKAEPREVECGVSIAQGQYTVVRLDTGEVVHQRAATADELQMTIEDATAEALSGDGAVPQSEQ